ncbi:MAG: flagellar basal body-associated FliL family protein [Rhodanobacter sp.]|nr:flagellar basal body-associated FliL family protein [Rhodanobacter sp.]
MARGLHLSIGNSATRRVISLPIQNEVRMAVQEEEEVVEIPVAPRRRGLLVVGLIVGLLLVGGIVAYAVIPRHPGTPAHATRRVTAVKTTATRTSIKDAVYLPLTPPFVVNVKDGDSLRYLQVGITLMAHDAAALDAATAADPVIRDALLSLFSGADYASIVEPAGRAKLQAQALATVQKIVRAQLGRPGIDALYFTSFVIQ